MQIANITGLSDGEKQKLVELGFGLSIEEQSVLISVFDDRVISKENDYRIKERAKKINAMVGILSEAEYGPLV